MLDLDSEACSFDALRLDLPPMEYLRLGGTLQLATRDDSGFPERLVEDLRGFFWSPFLFRLNRLNLLLYTEGEVMN